MGSPSLARQVSGIHRGSIVPLESTAAITSTNLLMEDDVREKSQRKKLKRTASERKAVKKAKGGKEEKETEWIYEEKELKIAICCVIA